MEQIIDEQIIKTVPESKNAGLNIITKLFFWTSIITFAYAIITFSMLRTNSTFMSEHGLKTVFGICLTILALSALTLITGVVYNFFDKSTRKVINKLRLFNYILILPAILLSFSIPVLITVFNSSLSEEHSNYLDSGVILAIMCLISGMILFVVNIIVGLIRRKRV